MTLPEELQELPHIIVVAFWRQDGRGGTEFFVPLGHSEYLEVMSFISTCRPATAARRYVEEAFGLDLRSNARVFDLANGCVVAFTLTNQEADHINQPGAWLPAPLIGTGTGMLLQDIADRL